MDKLVLYATDDGIGMVTLNRPSKLNAINAELRGQLVGALRRADADPSTSVVILRAEGRSFCAGFDVEGGDAEKDDWRHDALRWHAHLRATRRLALIAPEALYAAKLAINRGAGAGGFHSALNAGLDIVAPLYAARTEVGQRFNEITRKDGLGAALKWRAAQFAE